MAVENGTVILLKSGSDIVGAGRSLSLSIQNSLVDVSSKDSGWMKRKYGRKNWNVGCDGVVDISDAGQISLRDATKDGSSLSLTIGKDSPGTGDVTFTGNGLAESWEESYTVDGEASYSGNVRGNGALTQTTN